MNKNFNYTIDAVITWVDGTDPLHQKKMLPYLSNEASVSSKNFRTRFDQVEEIEYVIKSILEFAPFVRKIFLVTDNQVPKFLKNKDTKEDYSNVKIIDHKTIFEGYEEYLPVFNSNSIETMLFKIPDLSEHFVYFNDDLFLAKNTVLEDFFENGRPIIRGVWKTFDKEKMHKNLYNKFLVLLNKKPKTEKVGYKRAQQNIAKVLGFNKYLRLDHTPCSMRKSVIENYFRSNDDMLLNNIKYKFRHHSFFMIQSLANYLEIKNNTYVLKKDYQLCYVQSYKKPLLWYKMYFWYCSLNSKKLFMCLQSLDQCSPVKLKYILGWLQRKISK